MRYAGVGLRAVATALDAAVLFALFYVVAALAGQTTATGFELTGAPFFVAVALGFAYYIVLEAVYGATLGKMAVRLRVAREEDGGPIDWAASVVRNVLRVVDGLFFYLVGAILVWQSPKRQRLGDRVAGTVVLRREGPATGPGEGRGG